MVIGGEITITRGGKAETFHVGDSCAVAAGEIHAEHVGPQGVALSLDAAPLQREAQLLKFLAALDGSPTISGQLRIASPNSASMRATST